MLRSECSSDYCYWRGEPYKPNKKRVPTTQQVTVGHGSYVFEVFDQYGHTAVYSRGYPSFAACEKEARVEVEKHNRIEGYGPCRAVIWPPSVKVKGVLIKKRGDGSEADKR